MEQSIVARPQHSARTARRATPDQSHNFGDKVIREREGDTRKRATAAAVGREKELIG